MPIPPFQQYLLPALELLRDDQVHSLAQAAEALAVHFKLNPTDRAQMLPSEVRHRYQDRAIWAFTYLYQAELASRPTRGKYRITSEGFALLKEAPTEITQKFLIERYPAFKKFARPKKPALGLPVPPGGDDDTPLERLEDAHEELQSALESELLDRIANISSEQFEHLVLDVLRSMGYASGLQGVGHTGQSGDEGIDGIISQDHLGLERVFVQAKNWEGPVPGPELSKFVGAMDLRGATKGVFFTRSTFTSQAQGFAEKSMKRIVLIDGERLANLMIQFGIGVTQVHQYKICRIDGDYFEGIE